MYWSYWNLMWVVEAKLTKLKVGWKQVFEENSAQQRDSTTHKATGESECKTRLNSGKADPSTSMQQVDSTHFIHNCLIPTRVF